MRYRIPRAAKALVVAALTTAAVATPALAQAGRSSFDRTVQPRPGTAPQLQVPTWSRTRLANGAELIVSERHALPLVSVTITWVGGANQFEPANKTGLANIVASMLTEGTTNRNGDQISNDLQLLGTSISTSIGGESGRMSFVSMKDKMEPVLAIAADLLVNPTFPEDALDRLRQRTLVGLRQARDRTNVIAGNVFQKTLYGTDHPYGRYATEQTIGAITRDDVVAFHRQYFKPGSAIITVVGDVTPEQVRASIERALAPWPAGGSRPTFGYTTPPAARGRTIFLVDKPGAAQSSFALGLVGPSRDTPDYYALEVLNTMLGGMFQSRLNANIREAKGYSYGVGSGFAYGKGPGAFRAGGDIMTAKTDSALVEFMKELAGVRGDIPITDDEIRIAKESIVQGLPEYFSSVGSTSGSITSLYTQGLAEDYYQNLARQINAVTRDDLLRVARRYLDLDNLAIVIVGDRATIEEPLTRLRLAPIVRLDLDGNPMPASTTP